MDRIPGGRRECTRRLVLTPDPRRAPLRGSDFVVILSTMAIKNSIRLSAEADYGQTGQFVARVTGPDPKYGTELEFLGSRSGKRNESTAVTVIDPGLYKTRSVKRKGGKDDSHVVLWVLDDVLVQTYVTEADALKLARELTPANVEALGRRVEIADTEDLIATMQTRNPDELVDVSSSTALELGIEPGKIVRKDLIAARLQFVQRMRAPRTAFTAGRQALEARRDALRAQMEPLQRELEEIEAALKADAA